MSQVRFVLLLHNHQPVGNFDGVFKRACVRAYEPFLKVLAGHPGIPVVMHYSGCLLEWIEANRPGQFEEIRSLVGRGQVELLGGGFYEPILGMLPGKDLAGQVCGYRDWLHAHLGADVRGIWLTERLWEQPLVKPLKRAGVEYTVVDDSHFKYAGLKESEFYGYFLTGGGGETMKVFPCSERLRYAIPFEGVEKTIEYLRHAADTHRDAVVVYADDGEKFGLWPHTSRRVYGQGWLDDFFGTLHENRDWIKMSTLGQIVEEVPPAGKVNLPSVSYREMMEWALAARKIPAGRKKTSGISGKRRPLDGLAGRFAEGGSWRNFLAKYPEANQMYARMLEVSRKISSGGNRPSGKINGARRELYKAQCNDAYWHGIFGGLYLPHLRTAVFNHLLRAEALTDSHRGVRLETDDYDLDAVDEFKMAGPLLNAYFKPSRGGHLYELDYRPKGINLINTLTRRKEAYHRKLLHEKKPVRKEGVKSIHDLEPKAAKGLERYLLYDSYRKVSLIDHFFPPGTGLKDFICGQAVELGDFVTAPYAASVKKHRGRNVLQMGRSGIVRQGRKRLELGITKMIEMRSTAPLLIITYCLENLSRDEEEFSFGVEFNLSMSAGSGKGRYYRLGNGASAGSLAVKRSFPSQKGLSLVDEELGLAVAFGLSEAADVWVCPVETVSQNESGFEKVYQCSTILLKWDLALGPGAKWGVDIRKEITETG